MEFSKRFHSPFTWLYLAAAVLLLFDLGTGGIFNSEGRWFAVAQEMLKNGDYLHPTINGQAYFDKPLVSYWLICLFSLFTGGVNGWSARLPSALAGLLALFCTVRIARQLFGERAALWSGWVLTTVYSFSFWGRSAEADMEQVAAVMGALAVYFTVREKPRVWGYVLFWSICAVGAQTKGLGAIILPAGVAGVDMLLDRSLLKHLRWRSFVGLFAGCVIYALPFVLEACSRGEYSASGIELVFRENIVRVVNPWDHNKDPWWIYFIYLPRLLLPWTPFFVLALVHYVIRGCRKEKLPRELLWLLLSIALIFVLFSASRSRRVYYILPAVPFCAMLAGVYLSGAPCGWTGKVSAFLQRFGVWVLAGLCVLALAGPAGLLPAVRDRIFPADVPTPFCYAVFMCLLPLLGIGVLAFLFRAGKFCRKEDLAFFRLNGGIWTALLVYSVTAAEFGLDPAFRTGQLYALDCRAKMFSAPAVPETNVAFWDHNFRGIVYYLDLPKPARLYSVEALNRSNRNFFSDTVETEDLQAFREFLRRAKREGGAVLMRREGGDLLRRHAPDLAAEFFLPDGSLRPEVFPEQLTAVERRLSGNKPRKVAEIMRKKMIFRVWKPGKTPQVKIAPAGIGRQAGQTE